MIVNARLNVSIAGRQGGAHAISGKMADADLSDDDSA